MLVTYLLFLLGALFSIFGQDIRRIIGRQPMSWRQAKIQSEQARLALLKTLHGDTYQLLLWGLWGFCYAAWNGIRFFVLIMAIDTLIDWKSRGPKSTSLLGPAAILAGAVMGQAGRMYFIIRQLYEYPTEVALLEKSIADLSSKSSSSGEENAPSQSSAGPKGTA
jgi:hypothetical protein